MKQEFKKGKRKCGQHASHLRHHVRKGVVHPQCPLCRNGIYVEKQPKRKHPRTDVWKYRLSGGRVDHSASGTLQSGQVISSETEKDKTNGNQDNG